MYHLSLFITNIAWCFISGSYLQPALLSRIFFARLPKTKSKASMVLDLVIQWGFHGDLVVI
jgi:hypothetical protein